MLLRYKGEAYEFGYASNSRGNYIQNKLNKVKNIDDLKVFM